MADRKRSSRGQARREDDPNRLALGRRIREIREQAGIGLRELARRGDCSPGLISQIEHGSVAPSVATLYAIATALQVPVERLFDRGAGGDAEPAAPTAPVPLPGSHACDIVRAGERRSMVLPTGVRWNLLAAGDEYLAEFREIVYEPGAMATPPGQTLRHEGLEYGYVIEGSLGLQVDDEVFTLSASDSVAFSARQPHRLWNESEQTARAIWLIQPEPAALPQRGPFPLTDARTTQA